MSNESAGEGESCPIFKVPQSSWVRKGRENVDVGNIPVKKIKKKAERGFFLGNLKRKPDGKTTADVHRTIVEGDDQPPKNAR